MMDLSTKIAAVRLDGLNDGEISTQEQAVLEELFAYDKNDTTDVGLSGTEYDNLSLAGKLANLTEKEIAAFAEDNNLDERQTKKLQNIFEDAKDAKDAEKVEEDKEAKKARIMAEAWEGGLPTDKV